jgi:hypothetical protein
VNCGRGPLNELEKRGRKISGSKNQVKIAVSAKWSVSLSVVEEPCADEQLWTKLEEFEEFGWLAR